MLPCWPVYSKHLPGAAQSLNARCGPPARRFVKWVQQTFTAGGHQSELVPLLERCTRELQGREEYREDVRYLRVWLQYVRPRPPAPTFPSYPARAPSGDGARRLPTRSIPLPAGGLLAGAARCVQLPEGARSPLSPPQWGRTGGSAAASAAAAAAEALPWCSPPEQVNNIGQGFSMYYESHATYLELRGNFKRAEDVYTDGINR